ncbi:MAG: LysR substrate-binding domain-containing protein [Cocleimonas sp.]
MLYSQLPPLNSIKAFDAVVRHGSISEAARILFVSQSAVSRHIIKLEDFLGSQLLYRGKQGASVTKEGQEFFDRISHSLNGILDATVNIKATQSGVNIVRVSSLSSFALKWFVPKLSIFQSLHPDIILDISIADDLPDFEYSQKDCAIVSQQRNLFDIHTEELFEEELIVVASPSMLIKSTITEPDHLIGIPLIHTTSRPELWHLWNDQNNSASDDALVGLTFQDFYISIAACVAGSGVGLIPSFLVKQELENKTLAQPLKQSLKTGKHYGIAISPSRKKNDAVIAFRDWLIKETANESTNP